MDTHGFEDVHIDNYFIGETFRRTEREVRARKLNNVYWRNNKESR